MQRLEEFLLDLLAVPVCFALHRKSLERMFVAGRNDQVYTPLELHVLSWHLQAHGEGT